MKQTTPKSVLARSCGALLLSSLAIHAQQDTGLYLKAGVGGAWTSDTSLKEFFGPVAPGSKITFDPGARFILGGGYRFNKWFAVEAETGVIANDIKSVTDAYRVDDATFSNVPFLLGVRFQCPESKCPLSPYFGGGLGGAMSVLAADHLDLNGTSLHGSESAAVFAYQAFGGVRYKLNRQMAVSLEYRYFGSTAPGWEASVTAGTETDQVRFGGAETHSVNLAFEYKF